MGANSAVGQPEEVAPRVVQTQSKYTCYCQVAKPNLLCLGGSLTFATAFDTFIRCWEKGVEGMPLLYKVTFSGLLLRPNSEAIFQTLLVWSVRRKRGRKRGARITGSYSENCLAARTRLGWKGGKGLHCPLTDKWTGSIDCKVFWWGGELGQSTIAVFLFDTWSLNLLA